MELQDIASEIIALKDADLTLRSELMEQGELIEGYHPSMEALHNENASALNVIIKSIGYPTKEKVGKEASDAAWLIIQHAISQPSFMKRCALLLKEEVNLGKADPIHLAYLTDRIAVFEGKPQLYGSQFDWDEYGQMSPNVYDHIFKVNERRRAIGLNSLQEQIEIMRSQVQAENQKPPQNLTIRKERFNQWRKLVGWIK